MLYRVVQAARRGTLPHNLSLQSRAQSRNKEVDRLLERGTSQPPSTQTPQPVREPQPAPSPTTNLPSIISPRVWERINSTFNPFASSSSAPSSSTSSSDLQDADPKSSGKRQLPGILSPSLILAVSAFTSIIERNWSLSQRDLQPKGSFLVFGEVEVIGEKARAKCDVQAAYDPKEGKYLWVVCNVKHLWELKQRAKGGR